MIKVQSCAIRTVGENDGTAKPADTNQKIIANSQLVLQLDFESLFPGTVVADSIKVSMSHSEFNTRLPESPPPPPPPPSAGGRPHQRKTSVVHRSSSTRSTASAMSSSSSRRERQVSESSGSLQFSSLAPEGGSGHEGDDDGDEKDVVWPRLKLQDVRDGKADGGLSAVRLVCRNAAQVLRRKDSTGAYLSPGASPGGPNPVQQVEYFLCNKSCS